MSTPAAASPANPWMSVQALVGIVSAIVGVVAAVQALASKDAATESARQAAVFKERLETRAADRADREVQARLDAQAYGAVVAVLELQADKLRPEVARGREQAVMALIAATASDALQQALFAAVESGWSISAGTKAEAAAASRLLASVGSQAAEGNAEPLPPPDPGSLAAAVPTALSGYRVVVFHCASGTRPEDDQRQQRIAQALVAEMQARPDLAALGLRWEVKQLPAVLNASPGYRVDSNQIRFNRDDGEEAASLALAKLLGGSGALPASQRAFDRRLVRQRTPQYLSVFVCGFRAGA